MELLIVGYVLCPIVAISVSFAYGRDADSPMGDGMILGILVLAVPLWPLTMTFWALYILSRHRNAVAERERREAALLPATRTPPKVIPYGISAKGLDVPIPPVGPSHPCSVCGSDTWLQTSPIRHRFGTIGSSFRCQHCSATRNFDIVDDGWNPSFGTKPKPQDVGDGSELIIG